MSESRRDRITPMAGCSGRVSALGETTDGETFTGTFDRRADGLGGAITLRRDTGLNFENDGISMRIRQVQLS